MTSPGSKPPQPSRPFRRAVLRGLGIAAPPLLTVLVFLWILSALNNYVLQPIQNGAEQLIVWRVMKHGVLDEVPEQTSLVERGDDGGIASFEHEGLIYRRLYDAKYILEKVYLRVLADPGSLDVKTATTRQFYGQYVRSMYLKPSLVIPLFVAVFILLMYLTGKFVSAKLGRVIWRGGEIILEKLPVVRNVYSSVKQITDFMFSEREIEYTRVVALEYPRKGIWSVGFVTGESMLDLSAAANEPVFTVLIPTSPMPATGYTITVPKSETIDLNLTFDQAIQFIVSCGVVVPPHQQQTEPPSAAAAARLIESQSRRSSNGQVEGGAVEEKAIVQGNGHPGSADKPAGALPPGDS